MTIQTVSYSCPHTWNCSFSASSLGGTFPNQREHACSGSLINIHARLQPLAAIRAKPTLRHTTRGGRIDRTPRMRGWELAHSLIHPITEVIKAKRTSEDNGKGSRGWRRNSKHRFCLRRGSSSVVGQVLKQGRATCYWHVNHTWIQCLGY